MNNNIIPFKKDIIFKTKIADITDISLTHDYKILDNMIEGYFLLSGSYKITDASVSSEEFYHNIPFSISLSERIKKESINLTIEDFKYSFKKDVLTINIDLNLNYDEMSLEEETINNIVDDIPRSDNLEEVEEKIEVEEIPVIINPTPQPVETESTLTTLLSDTNTEQKYTTYKVHIVRNDDTFESIASKYNVSLDNIKEYNKIENLNVGDKILVPFINNE